MKIYLPPVRERLDDIISLAYQFLKDVTKQNIGSKKNFALEVEEVIKHYDWPGNARELQNLVHRAYFLSSGQLINIDDIPLPGLSKSFEIDEEIINMNYKDAKSKIIEKFEIAYLLHCLKKNEGNISKTADKCAIDRRSIHRLINTYNIVYRILVLNSYFFFTVKILLLFLKQQL